MARYTGPVCRLCRREGMKLFLKGDRCYSEKCAIEKRNFQPGQHGRARRAKVLGYGIQLREKQRTKRYYGVLERQFRNAFEKASKIKGITGENLLGLMEHRLDNVVYRLGIATSRAMARQVVRHGHIQVNGRKVNIPSFLTKQGDVVEVRQRSKQNTGILAACDATASRPAPTWLEFERDQLRGRVTGQFKRQELVQIQINEQLIVELYSK
ncbi:MAG: 30S ribosomal protein S4 [Candidatus Solibacter usitatus]|nr:30S ribosomal protein S4 [Candidatus Solibacter usitatus]